MKFRISFPAILGLSVLEIARNPDAAKINAQRARQWARERFGETMGVARREAMPAFNDRGKN